MTAEAEMLRKITKLQWLYVHKSIETNNEELIDIWVKRITKYQLSLINQFKENVEKPYIEILKVAKCPDCGGRGWLMIAPRKWTGEYEQIQCQWCFKKNLLLKSNP